MRKLCIFHVRATEPNQGQIQDPGQIPAGIPFMGGPLQNVSLFARAAQI